MTGGIRFDNVIIGFDPSAARKFAERTWRIKHGAEKVVKRKQTDEEVRGGGSVWRLCVLLAAAAADGKGECEP
jgi:hypothetical protein